jgi:hypothetical protein
VAQLAEWEHEIRSPADQPVRVSCSSIQAFASAGSTPRAVTDDLCELDRIATCQLRLRAPPAPEPAIPADGVICAQRLLHPGHVRLAGQRPQQLVCARLQLHVEPLRLTLSARSVIPSEAAGEGEVCKPQNAVPDFQSER